MDLTPLQQVLFTLPVVILVSLLVFVAIIRWVFQINDIVKLLEEIRDSLKK